MYKHVKIIIKIYVQTKIFSSINFFFISLYFNRKRNKRGCLFTRSATPFTMETLGNLTTDLRGAKDSILLEHLRAWFSTNNISILIVSIVGLILITVAILFTGKVIHNIFSKRRRKNCYECPNDRLSEPVHYEMISNIVV